MNSIKKIDFQASIGYLSGYAYFLLSAFLIVFVLSVDRTDLLDNDNYIEYFSNSSLLQDFFQKISTEPLAHAILLFLSEEPVWLLYAQTVSSILNPTLSVYFTVLLLNGIIIYSCSKFEHKLFGLLLWTLLPVGVVCMGLYQIRQGLALSIFMLFFVRRWNLTFGALIAAMIHTTFIIPLMAFSLLLFNIFRSRPLLFFLVFGIISFFLAFFFYETFKK
ncbi:MAG: EpsG family protein [Nitrososphaeraceae archaeon]